MSTELLFQLADDKRFRLACIAGSAAWVLWWARPHPRFQEWPKVAKSPDKGLFQPTPPPGVTRARHGYQNFPPPFPNGWMFVGPSTLVGKRDVVPLYLWGRDMVLFRGKDGDVGLLDAWCPHMGTHIGYGGYVKDNNVLCPYHEWAFDKDGVLKNIPHLEDGGERTCQLKANHLRKFPIVEKHGMIFAWMHADDAEPLPFWICDPIDKLKLQPRSRVVLGRFNMHVQEPAHNSCDWYHFKTVHSTLGQHWHSSIQFIKPHIWSPPSRSKLGKSLDDDGRKIEHEDLMITDQFMKSLYVFGIKVPQWIVDGMMKVQVRFCGCMLGSIKMDLKFLGTYYGIVQMTPQGVFNTHCEIWGFGQAWTLPNPIAWLLTVAQSRTIYQDKEVWEYRTHPRTRNRVKGEYNWKQFDDWVGQFYSKSSMNWDNQDLRW